LGIWADIWAAPSKAPLVTVTTLAMRLMAARRDRTEFFELAAFFFMVSRLQWMLKSVNTQRTAEKHRGFGLGATLAVRGLRFMMEYP
jgi:hypothetical protein